MIGKLLLSATLAAAATSLTPATMLAPGVLSTPVNEFGGTIAPNDRELFFAASVHRSYMYALYVSYRDAAGNWGRPELLPFSGNGRDFDAVFAPDGRTMFFVSDRPLPGSGEAGYHLWQVSRDATGRWGAPEPMPAPINRREARKTSTSHEWFVSQTHGGTIYMAAVDRNGSLGLGDIYRAARVDGTYEEPINLGEAINGPGFETEPYISPDERFLLYSSTDRPGGLGDFDIYISCRGSDGRWIPAVNLGPQVNGPARDYSPRLAPDGRTLIFTSERSSLTGKESGVTYRQLRDAHRSTLNGYGNLYTIDLRTVAPALACLS